MDDKEIAPNVFVVYSPDEGIYFLELRIPWNWANSEKSYNTQQEAIDDYLEEKVVWEKGY